MRMLTEVRAAQKKSYMPVCTGGCLSSWGKELQDLGEELTDLTNRHAIGAHSSWEPWEPEVRHDD
jgi:hypothetical protein